MTAVPPTTAPIERVTVPLQPRTAAACCDLAVMFYGRHLGPLLRLYVAVAGPAVVLVYGLGRFAATDLTVALIAAILLSKLLGILTVTGTARTTFGEPFERNERQPLRRRTRLGRLRELTDSMLTGVALLAAFGLLFATLDDELGTGRLAALGPGPAAVIVALAVSVLVLRSAVFLTDRVAPDGVILRGLLGGLLLRVLLAAPLGMLFFDKTRTPGLVVVALWLPIAAWVALLRSFSVERRALSEIDPTLSMPHSGRPADLSEMAGPALVVACAVTCLSLVALASIEFAFTMAGASGPITGPIGDSFDPEFFEIGHAFRALGRSPLFQAASLAAILFAYQLGRIAWFFVDIDARVRNDCWDMELRFAREAKRLEGE